MTRHTEELYHVRRRQLRQKTKAADAELKEHAAALRALTEELHAYRKEASQENKIKEPRERSLVHATWCAAIAAVVAAVLSLVSVAAFVYLTLKTDSTAQSAVTMSGNQLKVMEDQGRPWIEASASDRAPWRGVGLVTSSCSPARLAGFIRLPRRAA